MASPSESVESRTIALKPEVLVLGGGVVGISIAQFLARATIQVTLVEKEERLGGRFSELRTFYDRPGGVQAWMDENVEEIRKNPRITALMQAELKRVDGHFGRF